MWSLAVLFLASTAAEAAPSVVRGAGTIPTPGVAPSPPPARGATSAPDRGLGAGRTGQTSKGWVAGRVLDAGSAAPVVGAQVFIEGSAGALTDLDGRYVLRDVEAGVHTVRVRMLGYASKGVTGVTVLADRAVTLDITLEQRAVELEGITVSAARERGSATFLLDQRRTASALVEAVGSSEISRRPDSDAADVAQRMTGVTVTDGRYVFVRGLGGRYSQTSLDGSSLPSPEPEKEVVPLDLFPAGFLESLETQKSYTPDLPADFSGGSVKIRTRDFPSAFTMKLGVSTSFNTNSQGEDGFLRYAGGGHDWLGLDDGTRAQPAVVEDLMGSVRSGERLPGDPGQLVRIGQALRGVAPGFAPGSAATPLNRSFDLSVGGSTGVSGDGELGFFVAGTYSDTYELRRCDARTSRLPDASSDAGMEECQEVERKWTTSAFDPETAEIATPNVDYGFTRGTRSVRWGTVGNVTLKLSPTQKLSFRTTANLNTDDEARAYQGDNGEDVGGEIFSERARFVERLMLWGQLSGEHRTFADARLDWRVTAARAERDEPLMRETIYLRDPVDGEFYLLDFTESARYFYSELVDDDLSAALDWRIPFGYFGREAAVKIGGAWRSRTRDFGARRLNWRFLGGTIRDLDGSLEGGVVVGSAPRSEGEFLIDEVVEPGDVYDADDRRAAGYLMVEMPLTDRLQAIAGTRVERYGLDLTSRGETLEDVDQTDVAPSLNLVYSLRDDLKLRTAVSRTLDRPEFREIAPFQFTEATSLRQLYGNPDLESATITSVDLRSDWFPGPGELVSVGGFFKRMSDPVEQVFIAAASSAYSFQNSDEASIAGIELDVQLSGRRLAEALEAFSFQGNYSWIDSEVTVVGDGIFQPTNPRRPLEGQASYVLNLGLGYRQPGGLEASVYFNRFGERIEAAGGSGVPDILEQPRNALDATLGFGLPRDVRAKIEATNLLDAPFVFEQSANGFTRVQRRYSVGRTFSVGLSWEF